jgi:hypothetical protein
MKTVIVRLMGGLGNQLFQYAAGRAAALKSQSRLRLDVSWYANRIDREYVLSHFDIQEDLLSSRESLLLRYWTDHRKHRRAKAAVKWLMPPLRVTCFSDPAGPADPTLFAGEGHWLLEGFWQSPIYFDAIGDLIRRELNVRSAPNERNAALENSFGDCESVAVHVRRGDYVSDPRANRVHGTCDRDYYEAAATLVCDRVASPKFFVFSDDLDAARNELRLPGPTEFIDGNTNSWDDLRLMRSCRHHIIANSTFSWWGAWLAAHPAQVVIAPKDWFRPGAKPAHHADDLIPASWIRAEAKRDGR